MKTIRLYGDMGKRFGRVFKLDVATPAEAIRALSLGLPGFRQYLQERTWQPFQVITGTEARDEKGLLAPVGTNEVIKIVPVVRMAKGGVGQVLIGAALIAASIYTGGATSPLLAGYLGTGAAAAVGAIGWSMALGGVAQLLSNAPSSNGAGLDGAKDASTWAFGSPTMTTGQGGCVPYCGGLHRISGHIISSGIDAHTYQDKGFGGAAPDNAGTRGGNGDTLPWVWAIAE